MTATASRRVREWVDTPETFGAGFGFVTLASVEPRTYTQDTPPIVPFLNEQERMRTHPHLYDERDIANAHENWLIYTGQSEFECCGITHTVPDAEYFTTPCTECSRTPGEV